MNSKKNINNNNNSSNRATSDTDNDPYVTDPIPVFPGISRTVAFDVLLIFILIYFIEI